MWSRIFNLFFVQLFLIQASAFASTGKYLSAVQLETSVTALKKLTPEQKKSLYFQISPMVHKDDIEIIEDYSFFKNIVETLTIEGDTLVVNYENEKAYITDIDFKTLTMKFNGKKFNLKKSVREQLHTLAETTPQTSVFDFLISSAYAEKPPIPGKLKMIGMLAAGSVVAVMSIGGVAFGWMKSEKGAENAAVEEIQAPNVEEIVQQDCLNAKNEVQNGNVGEVSLEEIKDKLNMMKETYKEAKKMKMTDEQTKWISQSQDCYGGVIELIEKKTAHVKDDSTRAVKDVSQKSGKKSSRTKSSKQ